MTKGTDPGACIDECRGRTGQKGQTRGPVLTSVEDVREEVKEVVKCFVNDLCRLNQDRGRKQHPFQDFCLVDLRSKLL